MSFEGGGGSELSEIQESPQTNNNEVSPDVDKHNKSELSDVNDSPSVSDSNNQTSSELPNENEELPNKQDNKNEKGNEAIKQDSEMPDENSRLPEGKNDNQSIENGSNPELHNENNELPDIGGSIENERGNENLSGNYLENRELPNENEPLDDYVNNIESTNPEVTQYGELSYGPEQNNRLEDTANLDTSDNQDNTPNKEQNGIENSEQVTDNNDNNAFSNEADYTGQDDVIENAEPASETTRGDESYITGNAAQSDATENESAEPTNEANTSTEAPQDGTAENTETAGAEQIGETPQDGAAENAEPTVVEQSGETPQDRTSEKAVPAEASSTTGENSQDSEHKPPWDDISTPNEDGTNTYRIKDYEGEGDQRNLLNSELPPNATIEVPLETSSGNFNIKTDDMGRVSEFNSPKVDFFDGERSSYQQGKSIDIKDGERGFDDGGHLYPRQWGGPKEQVNLVPMDSAVNRNGDWREMERDINKELESGNDVTNYSVKPQYEGDSRRPNGFDLSYEVNGENRNVYIDNPNIGGK